MSNKKTAMVIRNIGDYHAPRLLQLQSDLNKEGTEFLVIEAARASCFYGHRQGRSASLKKKLNYVPLSGSGRVRIAFQIASRLLRYRPQHILVLGYNDELSLTALFVGKLIGARVFFLSDSKADDQPRRSWSERIKSILIARFDGALVAGTRHKKYFSGLGMDLASIEVGYDVVDNAYFARRAAHYRKKRQLLRRSGLPQTKYVLCVSRLVRRKRVEVAIKIFAAAKLAESGFRLLIVGDGPELNAIQQTIKSMRLEDSVILCGSVRTSRMPLYFAYAEALLLTSEYDQWGLVVNEAMATGLPALVTDRCGCAGEIVIDGVNGYVWDGKDSKEAASRLAELVLDSKKKEAFGEAGRQIICQWGLSRFSQSAISLIHKSRQAS